MKSYEDQRPTYDVASLENPGRCGYHAVSDQLSVSAATASHVAAVLRWRARWERGELQMRAGLQTTEDGFGTSADAGKHGGDNRSIYGVQLVAPHSFSINECPSSFFAAPFWAAEALGM